MGRPIAQSNGNDKIMTPPHLCRQIVEHFRPTGSILEPCCGTGNFLQFMPGADWCEIDRGVDFLSTSGHWDWVITNPPYSLYRAFLNKAMSVAENVVFLQLLNATFYKARLRDVYGSGFGIKEMFLIDTPKEFPQFGFQMGCVHYLRGYTGDTQITNKIYNKK